MKKCTKCGELKSLDDFTPYKKSKDGKSTVCKKCRNIYAAIQRDKHRDNVNKRYRERYANDSEFKEKRSINNKKSLMKSKKNNPEYWIWQSAKSRAKKEGFEFTIELSDIIIPKICPILKKPLVFTAGQGMRNDYTPSLDKINPKKGYIKGNVCIISMKANVMKNNATREELENFAANILNYLKNEDLVQTIENEESIELKDKEPLG